MTASRLTAALTAAVSTPGYLRSARQIAGRPAREDSAASLLSELEQLTRVPK